MLSEHWRISRFVSLNVRYPERGIETCRPRFSRYTLSGLNVRYPERGIETHSGPSGSDEVRVLERSLSRKRD